MTEALIITSAVLEEGFQEINAWPDGWAERLKESGRLALSYLLNEEVSPGRLPKEEVLALLRRAGAVLEEGK